MIIDKTKFTFKWMLDIIKALEEEKLLSPFRISRTIGSCVPDAAEVTRMLYYITYFGRVVSNQEGEWRIVGKDNDSSSNPGKNFRFKYIEKVMEIMSFLSEETISEFELAQRISQDVHDIQQALSFLEEITGKGRVHKKEKTSPHKWCLSPW